MQEAGLWIPRLAGFVFEHLVLLVTVSVLLQLFLCYTVQVIADKVGVAASWLAWVPILQVYPVVKSGGGSFTVLAGWFVVGLGIALVGSILGLGDLLNLLMVPWALWVLVYFGRILWNTAENRAVSGIVGLLCFIPLLGLFAYLYIAFHDGPVAPSKLGLALGILLIALPSVPTLRQASKTGAVGAQVAELGLQMGALEQGEGDPREFLRTLEALGAEMEAAGEGEAGRELTRAFAEFASGFSTQVGQRDADPYDSPMQRALAAEGFDEQHGFPVADSFECPPGTELRGASPPAGFELWCVSTDPGRGSVKHGGYTSWHRNGQRAEAGEYRDGRREGVWTRWYPTGGKQTQARFRDGVQDGVLIAWDELGRKERQVWFQGGEPAQP
jgi:hypothetical protein